MTDKEIEKLAIADFEATKTKFASYAFRDVAIFDWVRGYKAAQSKEDMKDNKIMLLEEDLECVHKYLDDIEITREDSVGEVYSIVGRIKRLEEGYLKEMSYLETKYLAAAQSKGGWTESSVELPPIDLKDKWNADGKISCDVWTYSEFGRRVGRYYHVSGNWSIDGVHSGKDLIVSHWMPLPKAPNLNASKEEMNEMRKLK